MNLKNGNVKNRFETQLSDYYMLYTILNLYIYPKTFLYLFLFIFLIFLVSVSYCNLLVLYVFAYAVNRDYNICKQVLKIQKKTKNLSIVYRASKRKIKSGYFPVISGP